MRWFLALQLCMRCFAVFKTDHRMQVSVTYGVLMLPFHTGTLSGHTFYAPAVRIYTLCSACRQPVMHCVIAVAVSLVSLAAPTLIGFIHGRSRHSMLWHNSSSVVMI